MKIGVVGSCLGKYRFPGVLKIIKDCGFDYLELPGRSGAYQGSLLLGEENFENIKREIANSNLQVCALAAWNDFVQKEDKDLQAQVDEVQRVVDLAKTFDCDVVRVFAGEPKDDIPKDRWLDLIIGGFKSSVRYAQSNKVYLALENHGYITNDAEVELKILEEVGSDYLRLTVDTGNFRWFGHPLDKVKSFFKILAPYCVHTHLKDGRYLGKRGEMEFTPLGEGEVDIKFFIEQLNLAGFQRPLCTEYEGKEEPKEGCKKSAGYLREA